MSFDIILSSNNGMGNKKEVRESFMSACETITGTDVTRRGPTEVDIHNSFNYSVLIIDNGVTVDQVTLCFQIIDGDPHQDSEHPVWKFIKELVDITNWIATDTFTGKQL